jgi:hypothetical protein
VECLDPGCLVASPRRRCARSVRGPGSIYGVGDGRGDVSMAETPTFPDPTIPGEARDPTMPNCSGLDTSIIPANCPLCAAEWLPILEPSF